MIRVVLPGHLRILAKAASSEVTVEAAAPVTLASVLDALEARYPTLEGTLRDHTTKKRRDFVRFSQERSHPSRRRQTGVNNHLQPEAAFIGFFFDDTCLVNKIRARFCPAKRAIIGRY